MDDFNKFFASGTDWKEIAYQHNTGSNYQNKQDLIAVFYNGYSIDIKSRVPVFMEKYGYFPLRELRNAILEFRQFFPKSGRVKGVNYFDDLIELYIEKDGNGIKEVFRQIHDGIDKNLYESKIKNELLQKGNEENRALREKIRRLFDRKGQAYKILIQNNISINPLPLMTEIDGGISKEFHSFLMRQDKFAELGYQDFLHYNFSNEELETLLIEFCRIKADLFTRKITERIQLTQSKPNNQNAPVETETHTDAVPQVQTATEKIEAKPPDFIKMIEADPVFRNYIKNPNAVIREIEYTQEIQILQSELPILLLHRVGAFSDAINEEMHLKLIMELYEKMGFTRPKGNAAKVKLKQYRKDILNDKIKSFNAYVGE